MPKREDDRSSAAIQHDLVDLERRGWEALTSPNGAAFYAEVLSDDAVMVFPDLVLTRQESLSAIAGAAPWSSFSLEDVHVLPIGAEGGIVTYRAVAERAGGSTYDALMTSVYAKRDGAWRLVLHQQTPSARHVTKGPSPAR